MEIRPASADDFDAIASITNHYIAHTAIHFGTDPVHGDELRAHWAGKSFPWLVADEHGEVAGYAKAGTWRERPAYRFTVETGVYLAPSRRGRGLGRALYAALIERCRAAGYRSCVAGIALPNEASVRLHEALGFAPVGVVREAGFKFDAWHDVGFWQLRLVDALP